MPFNWLPFKRGMSKKQLSQNEGQEETGVFFKPGGIINFQHEGSDVQDEPDCLLKLRYLKTVQLMLKKKTSSSLNTEKSTSNDAIQQKNSSGSTIGERLQSWYKSSSRSTDPSVESQEFVKEQKQEVVSECDTDESILGIAQFLDFSKYKDYTSEFDEQNSSNELGDTCTSGNSLMGQLVSTAPSYSLKENY